MLYRKNEQKRNEKLSRGVLGMSVGDYNFKINITYGMLVNVCTLRMNFPDDFLLISLTKQRRKFFSLDLYVCARCRRKLSLSMNFSF